ncbi:hypothetical protein SteCoe_20429 [Stentor coeruleus]|uniref:AAA+ ATPase domain-containing protein n=1 Tax=Stentor coeruleus TaxID=5963 RepID=A0A1R2BSA3_9CILI|nr:hypothetical protein SteCoe_20429 [Stentor coeruleus]
MISIDKFVKKKPSKPNQAEGVSSTLPKKTKESLTSITESYNTMSTSCIFKSSSKLLSSDDSSQSIFLRSTIPNLNTYSSIQVLPSLQQKPFQGIHNNKPKRRTKALKAFQKLSPKTSFTSFMVFSKAEDVREKELLGALDYEKIETPKKRSFSESKPPYSETIPLNKLKDSSKKKTKADFTKCLPLDIYDPIIDPLNPEKILEKYSLDGEIIKGYSKWFFGNGTYEWRSCTIESYDNEKEQYLIKWPNDHKKYVSRINLRFENEDEKEFELRITEARKCREDAEIALRYNAMILQNTHKIPNFPTALISQIILFLSGKSKSNLIYYRNAEDYIKIPLNEKFNPKRFLWKEIVTHVVDESHLAKSAGVATHAEFITKFLNNIKEISLFTYKNTTNKYSYKEKVIDLFNEVEENWNLLSKNLDFQSRNREYIECTVFSSKLKGLSNIYQDHLSIPKPQMNSVRFVLTFKTFKENSFLKTCDTISILQRIHDTVLSLDTYSLFPCFSLKSVTIDEFIEKYEDFSNTFLNLIQNVIFDSQCDIQEILTREDTKRMERNAIKIKERVHSKQILELEESLPIELINFAKKLIRVCNMKLEDKIRDCLNISLQFVHKEFYKTKNLLQHKLGKGPFEPENLDIIKNEGSNFLNIDLLVNWNEQKVVTNPETATLKSKLFSFLNRVLQKISDLRCITTIQTGPSRANGYLQILEINSERYLQSLSNLELNILYQFQLIEAFILKIEPYYFTLSLVPSEVFQEFKKKNNDEIENEIYRLKRNEVEISEILAPENCSIGIWVINGAKVKRDMINSIEKVVEELFKLLLEDSKSKVSQIQTQYNEVLIAIDFIPANIEELEDIRKFISINFNTKIEFIDDELHYLFNNLEVLEGYFHHISYELYSKCWKCMGYTKELEKTRSKSLQTVSELLIVFTSQIKEQKLKLFNDIEAMGEKLDELKKEDNLDLHDKMSLEFSILKNDIQEAATSAKQINSREIIIEEEPSDFKLLDEIKREFTPYCKLWFFIRDFIERYPVWMSGPIGTLNRDLISTEINTYLNEIAKMEKGPFSQNPAALKLCKEFLIKVNTFKPYIPVIRAFNNPGMKERHWIEIQSKTKIRFSLNKNISLQLMIDNKIMDHLELLENVSELANKEMGLENAKKKMENEWSDINFEFSEFKGSYILINTDIVWDALNEHLMRTQAMLSSSFIKFIINEMILWKNNLLRIQDILENWEKFQRNWQYLQPIFASHDISRQLPHAANKFKSINSQWENIMNTVVANPNVYESCIGQPKILEIFYYGNESLESILKNLNEYLLSKRKAFPRFYFLSNEELVIILSNSQDLVSIQKYIVKCFEAIASVIIEDKKIVGMNSPEGEKVRFNNKIEFYVDDEIKSIEIWMIDIEVEMRRCLEDLLVKATKDWSLDLKTWVNRWPSQLIHASLMALWTHGAEKSIPDGVLGEFLQSQEEKLSILVDIVRGGLSNLERSTFSTMVVLDVHNKDIIENLINRKTTRIDEFSWFSQMRYYLVGNIMEIRMLDCIREYGYEYLGNTNRLVITGLTDRCYMTLMSALNMSLGGAPEGPAGTGKTETTKDLAKSIAKKCVVFNCSDRLDHIYMAKFFTGLCYCGAWACFDEFNRIELEVLSVIAEQILSIQIAVQKKAELFNLDQDEVKLNPTCAVFITMNPDYAGRSKLPDNLKALFRPVAMMIPDYAMIAEIYLYSYGFREARNLSRKITNSLKLASEQLSTQPHYDYGMRAVSTIIKAAGWYKQTDPKQNEDILVLRAIKCTNIPKFLGQDIPLFGGIVMDLFPGANEEEEKDDLLLESIRSAVSEEVLIESPRFIEKIFEIYRTVQLRHGLMIVGQSMAGKTCALKTLVKALSYNKDIELTFINPKSMTLEQLYGDTDPISQDWKDGILAQAIRNFTEKSTEGYQWIVLDGPVDAVWIESMNTVMDDNKKLCLSSGEIIKLTPSIRLIFEVDDLSQASPATVSRCGMIYMNPEDILGPKPIIKAWISYPPHYFLLNRFKDLFTNLFNDIFMPCLDIWFNEIRGTTPIQCSSGQITRNMIMLFQTFIIKKNKSRKQHDTDGQEEARLQLLARQDSMAEKSPLKLPGVVNKIISQQSIVNEVIKVARPEEIKREDERLSNLFIVAVQWSIGGVCDENGRKKFSHTLVEVSKKYVQLPENLQDCYYNEQERRWASWKSILTTPPKESNVNSILVPTISLVSYSFLLDELITRKENILIIGDTGTGKTVLIQSILQKLDKIYSVSSTMFSARSSSNEVQNFLESELIKRRKGYFGPEPGKFKIFWIDDLNMPAKEIYGAQPAVELLRSVIERNILYDRIALDVKYLEDVQYIGSMGHPGGGRNTITSRFMSKSFLLNFANYDSDSMFLILSTILMIGFSNHPMVIQDCVNNLTKAIIQVFGDVVTSLPPTPTKSHYTFNLRDLSNVLKGLFLVPSGKLSKIESIYKLWAHECLRVFADRLTEITDKDILIKILKTALFDNFKVNWDDCIGSELIFTNFLEDKVYQECTSTQRLKQCLENYLDDYNNENSVKMNLLMFDYAIEHISRISRVLVWNSGNLLLIGMGGSGRMSLTKLCAFLLRMIVFQIKLTKSYGMLEWGEDLKNVLKSAGQDEKKMVFILRDSEIIIEAFLENINNILNSGQAPNLFSSDEVQGVLEALRMNKLYSTLSDQQRLEIFISNVKKNLHIVLCMFPQGELMRTRLRQFPSLVNCCTIDWFTEWPEQALAKVAEYFIREESFIESEEKIQAAIKICVNFHLTVRDLSLNYLQEYKRYNYVTPTHYLLLLKNLKGLYQFKEATTVKLTKKYSTGVHQLDQTQITVHQLKEDLTALKPILEQKTILAEETLKKIQEENIEADKTRNLVASEQAACEIQAALANRIKKECEDALAKILPELEAAIKALDTIKKEDIDLVKTMHNPPEAVRLTLEAVAIMNKQKPVRQKDPDNPGVTKIDYYESGKKLLYINKFIEKLKKFDRNSLDDDVINKVTPYLNMPRFHPDVVKYASSAAEGMCKWVRAMYKFYRVNKEIKPKREALEEAERNVSEKTILLKQKQTELARVEEYIDSLRKKLDLQISEKNALIADIRSVEIKMDRAVKLIDQLSGERTSWESKVVDLSSDMENLLGDVLLSAAVVSYMGPFILSYREIALQHKWIPYINSLNKIICTSNYSLASAVGDPATLQKWTLYGLPSDKVSIENSLIIHHTLNWPLIIDPQGQASKWLKKMFTQLKVTNYKVKLENTDFMSTLENALLLGASLIIEDLKETIDPVLDPLLMKQWYKQDSMTVVKIGDAAKQIDPAFKLYMLSNYSNPHFSAEISTKVTLLNFTITEEGLAEQLLDLVCRKEMPKDTQERDQLILQSAEYRRNMQVFEDKILSMLQTGGSTILDNEELTNSLTESKTLSIEVGKKLAHVRQAEQKIAAIQNNYLPVSQISSVLYFCVADLCNIDHMYQFSMEWFVNIFKKGISEADRSKELNERVKNIMLKVREILFVSINTSLQEDDKVLFAFLISGRLQMYEGMIQPWQWKFFLTGLCGVAETQENKTNFLTDKSWREMLQLNTQIVGLRDDILNNSEKWKKFVSFDKIFTSLPPFEEFSMIIPEPYCKESLINRLLILRSLKPELVGMAVKSYVKSILGEKYLHPVIFSLQNIYKETAPLKPLVFVLTSGTDPLSLIKRYTNEIGTHLITVSLGKGQGERAEKIIRDSSVDGRWVLLQNCHLALSWLPRLELILEEMSSETEAKKIHHSFRLTLTAAPTEGFPVSILRKSVKAVSQLPSGLSNSLLGIYSAIADSKEESHFYESCSKPDFWKKLFFHLSFFHCVIRERGLYGPIGWNVKYEFNESDLRISSRQLLQMINQFPMPPFEALTHITAECNYGGRVTDDFDRRTLKEILLSFYNPDVLKETHTMVVPVSGYVYPINNDFSSITHAIKNFPQVQSPEIFGLHANAEISRSRKETYDICARLLALQPKAVSTSYDEQKASIIFMADIILSKISSTFDVKMVIEKYPLSYYESMNIVLAQELSRYNNLIKIITTSLVNIKKVYEGIILITEEYEILGQNMLKNKVPQNWMKVSYSSCKSLMSYIEDLRKRMDFFNNWIDNGRPYLFWISGFYFTQSFLTATLQEYSRKKQLPIDTLMFSFEVLSEIPHSSPEFGTYINGLFLEGARWNEEKLEECAPRELYYEFPVIWLKPTDTKPLDIGKYKCPVYRTLLRAGSLSTTGHSTNFILSILLNTDQPSSHWVKRGVALFTQLDD